MAETLGFLCDKLAVVKLKQWHTEKQDKLKSLRVQEKQLEQEINEFIVAAVTGKIPVDRMTFASNKVYKIKGNVFAEVTGTMGGLFSKLVEANCKLWHEQEKAYDFESIPAEEKDGVVKRLAILNLERNQCIDKIDEQFRNLVKGVHMKL